MKSSPDLDSSSNIYGTLRRTRRLIVVVILVVAIGWICLWFGARPISTWQRYTAEINARGESLDWKDYVPRSPPSDEENFGATPLLRSIGCKGKVDPIVWGHINGLGLNNVLGKTGDWMTGRRAELQSIQSALRSWGFILPALPQEPAADLLAVLEALKPEFDELRGASQRRYAKLKLAYPEPLSADVPNFVALRTLAQLLSLQASAELVLGRTNDAFADVRVIQRLADVNRPEPFLVSAMIYCAIHGQALQGFWEGWVSGQWSDQQLEAFQKEFATVDMLSVLDHAMRGERAGVNYLLETLDGQQLVQYLMGTGANGGVNWTEQLTTLAVRLSPPRLRIENLLYYNRLLDKTCFKNYDSRRQRVFPAKCDAAAALLNQSLSRTTAQNYLASLAVPNFTRAAQTVSRNQTFVNEALIVCSLERYRRTNGEYPATLELLTPRFLEKLPHDLITGKDLMYRTANGRFLLYSFGWNEKDDKGLATQGKDDWGWPRIVSE
jgi:hypothetical protein